MHRPNTRKPLLPIGNRCELVRGLSVVDSPLVFLLLVNVLLLAIGCFMEALACRRPFAALNAQQHGQFEAIVERLLPPLHAGNPS